MCLGEQSPKSKREVIEGEVYDPVLDCGHRGVEGHDINAVLAGFEGKRVRITIEEMSKDG